MPTCLLDKNVVRRAIEGIAQAQFGDNVTHEQLVALTLLRFAQQQGITLFISIEVENILARYGLHPDIQVFLRFVTVMRPARYFRRWSRRVRDHGFTREDAKVVALGTFGTDATTTILGVDQLATFHQPLINHIHTQQDRLRQRLQAMTAQLAQPYRSATLALIQCYLRQTYITTPSWIVI